ncbi:MAG: ATP-binding protein [Verrucomicrobia bacterium]|nr:ATP-binding protein [Verrucomicrobiota bacterium]
MAIVSSTPETIGATTLFQQLRSRQPSNDDAASRTQAFITAVAPQLDLILSGPFREYTLHNRVHSLRLIHLVPYLIPDDTLKALSSLELQLFIYAAYFHDLGMSLTSTELERVIGSAEYLESLRAWPILWRDIQASRMNLSTVTDPSERSVIELRLAQLHNAGLSHHLRPLHATPERYRSLIRTVSTAAGRDDLFSYNGISFADHLVDICASHNLPVSALLETKDIYEQKYSDDALIAGQRVNVRFLCCLLRLADILDFDRERTPRILLESLGIESRTVPGAEVSLREWSKHLAVHTIEIGSEEIVFAGSCKHPIIEKAIRDFCIQIEREVRDTTALLRRAPAKVANRYHLDLPLCVRPRIQSNGYTFRDFTLSLNQSAISSILMGEKLYSHAESALRELIQNAIDACHARQDLSSDAYIGAIALDSYIDTNKRRWIRVRDNGIGMDEHVIGEYFLVLGNTYYDSAEFEKSLALAGRPVGTFVPISRFGIGIASVFMISDFMELDTSRFKSPRRDSIRRVVRVDRLGGLAYLLENGHDDGGTEIRIRLRDEFNNDGFLSDCLVYLRDTVVRPAVPVTVSILGVKLAISNSPQMKVTSYGTERLKDLGVMTIHLDLSRWSNLLGGCVIVFLADDGTHLSITQQSRKLILASNASTTYALHINPFKVLQGYGGNRVVVNGFRMSLRKMAKVFGESKRRLLCVFDIDVKGTRDITYDVARDRIIHAGVPAIKNELRRTIRAGLTELGVFDRLDDDSRKYLDRHFSHTDTTASHGNHGWKSRPTVLSDDILAAIKARLQATPWPQGIHKTIADELGISRRMAHIAISHLVQKGEVKNEPAKGEMREGAGEGL